MKTLSMLMLASIAVVATLNPARAADDTPLATAAHLTVEQARDLYSGKSWRWSDGAAYFSPDRKFVAWTGSGETASYATNRRESRKKAEIPALLRDNRYFAYADTFINTIFVNQDVW